MLSTDIVQVISLPLEIIGLTLTVIDTFFQSYNSKLEAQFQSKTARNERWWKIYTRVVTILLLIVCGSIMIMILGGVFLGIGEKFYQPVLEVLILISLVMLWGQLVFKVLCIFLPNRQLIALGITLTCAGIVGEIYQVFHIDF